VRALEEDLARERPEAPRVGIAGDEATARGERYDRTQLLLLGQERASVALLVDRDNLTLAAPFDSGVNFLKLLGLSGGMPTLVSVPKARLGEALAGLGVGADDASRLVG